LLGAAKKGKGREQHNKDITALTLEQHDKDTTALAWQT